MERKEKILEFLKDDRYPPVNIEEMMLMLDIPFDDREELSLILAELVEDGLIVKTNKRKYASPEKGLHRGEIFGKRTWVRLCAHRRRRPVYTGGKDVRSI